MNAREKFAAAFGEEAADNLMAAAMSHADSLRKGSDPFRWALMIAIGRQCMTKYKSCHGLANLPSEEALKEWVRANMDLRAHDGDYDFLAMVAGMYNDWLKPVEEEKR